MEIKINGRSVDFELQDEKSVSQILFSVLEWAAARELVVTEVEINGETFQAEQVPDKAVSDTDIINFVMKNKADVAFAALEEGINYCNKAIQFTERISDAAGQENWGNLAEGIAWLKGVISSGLNILSIDRNTFVCNGKPTEAYFDSLSRMSEALSAGAAGLTEWLKNNENAFAKAKELLIELISSDAMKKLLAQGDAASEPMLDELKAIREALPSELENLESTSIAFQSGKDKEGSQRLNAFIDFMFDFLRICHKAEELTAANGRPLAEQNRQLMEFLDEAKEALENQDYISLSDVLEYELKPALETSGALIDALIDEVKAESD